MLLDNKLDVRKLASDENIVDTENPKLGTNLGENIFKTRIQIRQFQQECKINCANPSLSIGVLNLVMILNTQKSLFNHPTFQDCVFICSDDDD